MRLDIDAECPPIAEVAGCAAHQAVVGPLDLDAHSRRGDVTNTWLVWVTFCELVPFRRMK